MQTIIPSTHLRRHRTAVRAAHAFRKPSYDCRELSDAVELVVYVPGVGASGVEIEARSPDLFITARKERFVRVNWQALHLERLQSDYQLRLRLGAGLDYSAIRADISEGVLVITVPKSATQAYPARSRDPAVSAEVG